MSTTSAQAFVPDLLLLILFFDLCNSSLSQSALCTLAHLTTVHIVVKCCSKLPPESRRCLCIPLSRELSRPLEWDPLSVEEVQEPVLCLAVILSGIFPSGWTRVLECGSGVWEHCLHGAGGRLHLAVLLSRAIFIRPWATVNLKLCKFVLNF